MRAGLALLHQACDLAAAAARDVWDFAVEIDQLRSADLTNAALRWLITQGHVEHRREVTGRRSRHRRFCPSANLALDATSCFVLTERGCRLATPCPAANGHGEPPRNGAADGPPVPHWDEERRQLLYDGLLVKEFRGRPGNQELMLTVFEEDGWPPRIDDPLPPSPFIDPPTRVRDTIRRLNRDQKHALLRFQADGRGAILWSPRER
jgi:hypothetical protein